MTRLASRAGILALAALLALSGAAWAGTITFTATLDGLQEVPPRATPGAGIATVLFDDVALSVDVDLLVSNLLAGAVAAHIQDAPAGVNGPVIVPLVLGGAVGQTNFHLVLNGLAFPGADVPDLLAGNTYLNVHTTLFPGGEIRGQLGRVVPEPASLVLLGVGLAALGVLSGWRRARR